MWSEANITSRCELTVAECTEVVKSTTQSLDIPKSASIKIIVAGDDDEDYGRTIRQAPGFPGGSTHSEGGVGKYVPHVTPSGQRISTVVFPRTTFTTIHSALAVNQTIESWDSEVIAYPYFVAHELGHAIDHCRRGSDHATLHESFGGTIEELTDYYGVLFADELAACLNALPAVHSRVLPLIAENAVSRTDYALQHLSTHGQQCYWVATIEWAKYAGSVVRTERLVALTEFARQQHEALIELINPFEQLVSQLEESYPEWQNESLLHHATTQASAFRRIIEALIA